MTEVYKRISVDLSGKSNVRVIFARQNDVGSRNLLIRLTDGGAKYMPEAGCTASISYKRSDGVCGAVAAIVLDSGEIAIELPQIILGAVGETVCSVAIYDKDKNKLSSSDIYLDVAEEFYSGEDIEADPEYTLLQSVFAQVAEFVEAEAGRIEAEEERIADEEARIKAEEERALADEERERRLEEGLVANLGIGGVIALTKAGWCDDLTQKITVDGLEENDMILFEPLTRLDQKIMTNYALFVDPYSSDGAVTFSADAVPASNISLRYFITKGRAV